MTRLTAAQTAPSAHTDTFARDNLPLRDLWPVIDMGALAYPAQLNCATELLDRHAAEDPSRTAFITPDATWTYGDLLDHANRIARVLVEDLGLRPGNRVLLRGPNNLMMAASWFAVLKAGGICVSTMPLLRTRELSYIIERAQVTLSLTDTRVAADLEQAHAQVSHEHHVVHFNAPGAAGSLETMMVAKSATFANVRTAADDVVLIAFTSGTTGTAKGTMHFHRDILAVADTFSGHVLRPDRDDVFCGSPPFAFTFGLGGLVMFPMRIGAASLLLEQASPPLLLEGIRAHGATICFTAPTAYRAMLDEARSGGVGRLRKCVSAGETLPRATFEAWEQATGIRIIDGIGSTEMLHIFISAAGEDIRPGSTGVRVPGYTACVLDEEGREAPRGSVGRLAVRGPTGCRYLADDERQATYVSNGWNVTGDAYIEDSDGYFWYQARTDDMIITGGYNIAGPEVENVLLEHAGVKECAVIGIPDDQRGNVVKAVIVLDDGMTASDETARMLQDFVKSQIAPYKYPRIIEFADALPRTETGKLQRYRLREESA
ncbi:MAG TPA: AMP-binding protein [Longimicrobiales bacterium]|nr:AMP-binding protein [Longimicrobiales bacterium]